MARTFRKRDTKETRAARYSCPACDTDMTETVVLLIRGSRRASVPVHDLRVQATCPRGHLGTYEPNIDRKESSRT